MKISTSPDRVEVSAIPEALLPFVTTRQFSSHAVSLFEWPSYIYAGFLHVSGHRLNIEEALCTTPERRTLIER